MSGQNEWTPLRLVHLIACTLSSVFFICYFVTPCAPWRFGEDFVFLKKLGSCLCDAHDDSISQSQQPARRPQHQRQQLHPTTKIFMTAEETRTAQQPFWDTARWRHCLCCCCSCTRFPDGFAENECHCGLLAMDLHPRRRPRWTEPPLCPKRTVLLRHRRSVSPPKGEQSESPPSLNINLLSFLD
ncbi:uncharacterized protein LOC129581379 [Paramacrobiotus metropolitanus]|uniref:uncharacterized protein LOC129581379 n=1 Tax=Paramacrobiotus metropolitanus TaxID=2943436 RepID=UPI0024458FB6|nr:uncharacterized protein LOC129581379 [Paramacrobiotus metropolitanus]